MMGKEIESLRADPRRSDSRTRIWPGHAFEHQADHCEADEGCDGSGIALEIARQAAIAADPGEGPLDDPSLGQDDESVAIAAFDDFDLPTAGPRNDAGHLRPLVSSIGEDAFDKREPAAGLAQQLACAIAILNVCRMDHDAQQQAERIDEDVAFATRDLLARIEALRIEP